MLVRGADHEINSGRIDTPRELQVTIDEEQSLDSFSLAEMKRRVSEEFNRTYNGDLDLSSIKTTSSRKSNLVQLADLIGGAINRKLSHEGDRNHKDEMAELIIGELGLASSEEDFPDLDATAFLLV